MAGRKLLSKLLCSEHQAAVAPGRRDQSGVAVVGAAGAADVPFPSACSRAAGRSRESGGGPSSSALPFLLKCSGLHRRVRRAPDIYMEDSQGKGPLPQERVIDSEIPPRRAEPIINPCATDPSRGGVGRAKLSEFTRRQPETEPVSPCDLDPSSSAKVERSVRRLADSGIGWASQGIGAMRGDDAPAGIMGRIGSYFAQAGDCLRLGILSQKRSC